MLKHRMFRVTATGEWAAAVLSDETFPDDGTEYADRVAADLGLPAGAVEVVHIDDGAPDPRTGALRLPVPPAPPVEAPPEPAMLTALRLPGDVKGA